MYISDLDIDLSLDLDLYLFGITCSSFLEPHDNGNFKNCGYVENSRTDRRTSSVITFRKHKLKLIWMMLGNSEIMWMSWMSGISETSGQTLSLKPLQSHNLELMLMMMVISKMVECPEYQECQDAHNINFVVLNYGWVNFFAYAGTRTQTPAEQLEFWGRVSGPKF